MEKLQVANKTVSSSKVNLPKALNICIPPYFPSNRTVLFNGLKARHILTKTTSKQPMSKNNNETMRNVCSHKEVITAYRSRDFQKL